MNGFPLKYIIRCDIVIQDCNTFLTSTDVLVSGNTIKKIGVDLAENYPLVPVFHFPDCILIPGLVNAHSHIELTLLQGLGSGLPFPEWLSVITAEIFRRDQDFFSLGCEAGIKRLVAGGVTALGDHSTFGISSRFIGQSGLKGLIYKEVFCPDTSADYSETMLSLETDMGRMKSESGSLVDVGFSLHAPYNAVKQAAEMAVSVFKGVPRSIHICESADEMSYIRSASGVIADRHKARGFDVKAHRMSPVEYMDNCSFWNNRSIAVHLTHASMGDMKILKNRGAAAIFCSVSNASLGLGVPPIRKAFDIGLTCGLGTDSAVTNEKLDMFEEMRFAVLSSRIKGERITCSEAFRMATEGGASALGLINSGKILEEFRADMAVVKMEQTAESNDPVRDIVMRGAAESVQAVFADGLMIFKAGEKAV